VGSSKIKKALTALEEALGEAGLDSVHVSLQIPIGSGGVSEDDLDDGEEAVDDEDWEEGGEEEEGEGEPYTRDELDAMETSDVQAIYKELVGPLKPRTRKNTLVTEILEAQEAGDEEEGEEAGDDDWDDEVVDEEAEPEEEAEDGWDDDWDDEPEPAPTKRPAKKAAPVKKAAKRR
jgi:hypothetical protein